MTQRCDDCGKGFEQLLICDKCEACVCESCADYHAFDEDGLCAEATD